MNPPPQTPTHHRNTRDLHMSFPVHSTYKQNTVHCALRYRQAENAQQYLYGHLLYTRSLTQQCLQYSGVQLAER
jgi:hypothetical protein